MPLPIAVVFNDLKVALIRNSVSPAWLHQKVIWSAPPSTRVRRLACPLSFFPMAFSTINRPDKAIASMLRRVKMCNSGFLQDIPKNAPRHFESQCGALIQPMQVRNKDAHRYLLKLVEFFSVSLASLKRLPIHHEATNRRSANKYGSFKRIINLVANLQATVVSNWFFERNRFSSGIITRKQAGPWWFLPFPGSVAELAKKCSCWYTRYSCDWDFCTEHITCCFRNKLPEQDFTSGSNGCREYQKRSQLIPDPIPWLWILKSMVRLAFGDIREVVFFQL